MDKKALIVGEQGVVFQGRDGNFRVRRKNGHKGGGYLDLNRSEFARLFGRIPPNGVVLRADVFIRILRLAGYIFLFETADSPASASDRTDTTGEIPFAYCPNTPIIRTFNLNSGPHDRATGLFLNDEGNFNVTPVVHGTLGQTSWSLYIPEDKFERMFGLDTRDYFANEVIRIASLTDISTTVVRPCPE